MKQYLLDTNICAYLFRGKYGIEDRIRKAGLRNCHISIITYAELYYGCKLSDDFDYNFQVLSEFCDNIDIIGIEEVIDYFATEKAKLKETGNLIEDFDILIGATALQYNMTLVTENVRHISRLSGIDVENWINRDKH